MVKSNKTLQKKTKKNGKTNKTLQKKTKNSKNGKHVKNIKSNKMKTNNGRKYNNIILGLIKKDLNRQVKLKIKTIYSTDLLNIIDLITLDNNYKIVGSYSYENLKYPNDIDITELYHINSKNLDEEGFYFADKISNIMVKIQLNFPDIIFSDFKAGYDERFFIDWQEYSKINKDYSKLISFNKEKFMIKVGDLYKKKYITKKEVELLKKILKNINIDTWFYMYNFFREKFIVRWEIEDILYSGKKLINKKNYFLLQDALIQTQIGKPNEYGFIKLDTLSFFENKYKEITNIFFICPNREKGIGKSGKGERSGISNIKENSSDKQFYKIQKETSYKYLKQDVYKYYFLKKYLKVVKRIFNIFKNKKIEKNKLNILVNLINSKLGNLNQINGELENIVKLLYIIKGTKRYQKNNYLIIIRRIFVQLLDIQNRLYSILQGNFKKEISDNISKFFYNYYDTFWETINNGLMVKQAKDLIELCEELNEIFSNIINTGVNIFLSKHNLSINKLISLI